MFSLLKRVVHQGVFWILALMIFFGFVFAAPVSFEVSISPDPIKVSEYADVTVKAIDSDGNIDVSCSSDIWIEVEGFDYTDEALTLPGGGVGLFEAADQGLKIFSKGLAIKKPGTYTLTVADVYDTAIKGKTSFTVLANSDGPKQSGVTVISPGSGSVEKGSVIDIIGKTTLASTPIQIFIDNVSLQEGISDKNGDFTLTLSSVEAGEHILKINALDLESKVVGTSGDIPFRYENDQGDLSMTLDIKPGKEVLVGEKIIFTVHTENRVTSVFLRLGNNDELPTEKVKDGEFRKQVVLSEAGVYPIDVRLLVSGNSTDFKKVDTVKVNADIKKILTLDYISDKKREKVDLHRTYEGKIDYFKVQYGTNKNNLKLSQTTATPKETLTLVDTKTIYYAQVFPVDSHDVVVGEPSPVVMIPGNIPVPICGNRVLEGRETCDDGNIVSGDGCSSVCKKEIKKKEIKKPLCGDGKREGGEECDDGNVLNGDGCSALCVVEKKKKKKDFSCYTNGIILKTKTVNGNYYIYRKGVPGAIKYTIYRSDKAERSTQLMTVVGETKETSFMYPFDPDSKIDQRARYAVEATCPDNTQKQIGDVTEIKVGPEDKLMIIFFGALIVFMGWRLIKT